MQPDLKLTIALSLAAGVLDARPDPVLASVARNTVVVGDSRPENGVLASIPLGSGNSQVWPTSGSPPSGSLSQSVDDLARLFVEFIDDLDRRKIITRSER